MEPDLRYLLLIMEEKIIEPAVSPCVACCEYWYYSKEHNCGEECKALAAHLQQIPTPSDN